MSRAYQKLAEKVIQQALVDAAAGTPVEVGNLEPWSAMAGLDHVGVVVVFHRIQSDDHMTPQQVSKLFNQWDRRAQGLSAGSSGRWARLLCTNEATSVNVSRWEEA